MLKFVINDCPNVSAAFTLGLNLLTCTRRISLSIAEMRRWLQRNANLLKRIKAQLSFDAFSKRYVKATHNDIDSVESIHMSKAVYNNIDIIFWRNADTSLGVNYTLSSEGWCKYQK